jgi:hypothetical protein
MNLSYVQIVFSLKPQARTIVVLPYIQFIKVYLLRDTVSISTPCVLQVSPHLHRHHDCTFGSSTNLRKLDSWNGSLRQ